MPSRVSQSMAAATRAATVLLSRCQHTSIGEFFHKFPYSRLRPLTFSPDESPLRRGNKWYEHGRSLGCSIRPLSRVSVDKPTSNASAKSGAIEMSLSEGVLDSTDFAEPERWSRGGGLFHEPALIDPTAVIEFGAIIHAHAKLGPNVYVGSGSVVGPSVSIGSSTRIGYNVSLQNCSVGDFCIIHNGACIGQDGFGHFVDEQGNMVKKPQLLSTRIGNHVEVGANTCIDRGSWRDTVIGDHTKIDNLVQIGHNVVIGCCCMLCGQVGIAGSVTLGDYVVLGGKTGVVDHITIVSNVRVAAKSGVTANITKPGDYAGFPAVPVHEWRKSIIAFCQIGRDPHLPSNNST